MRASRSASASSFLRPDSSRSALSARSASSRISLALRRSSRASSAALAPQPRSPKPPPFASACRGGGAGRDGRGSRRRTVPALPLPHWTAEGEKAEAPGPGAVPARRQTRAAMRHRWRGGGPGPPGLIDSTRKPWGLVVDLWLLATPDDRSRDIARTCRDPDMCIIYIGKHQSVIRVCCFEFGLSKIGDLRWAPGNRRRTATTAPHPPQPQPHSRKTQARTQNT